MDNYVVPVSIEGFTFKVPVSITTKENTYYYIVKEPKCDTQCLDLKSRVIEIMRQRNTTILDAVNNAIRNTSSKQLVESVVYYLLRDLKGYGPITVPLSDMNIEEVELNNWLHPITVVHRDLPGIRLVTNIRFNSEIEAKDFIMSISKRGLPRSISLLKPYLETILPEGHRFTGTIGEITIGPTFSIRKFPPQPLTLEELMLKETLKPSAAAYLWLIAELKGFIMITGPMSSGKTTLLSAIASKLPTYSKIVTIEDTPEIRLPHPHWIRMFTRESDDEKSRIEMFDLVKLAVRYRPDYIIVGEVRGEEVHALFQASALGHGMLTTFHASSPEELLIRLTNPPLNVNPGNLQLLTTVVFTAIRNGKRIITNIAEPEINNGEIEFKNVLTGTGDIDIERSMKLKILSKAYGIDVKEELIRRERMLRSNKVTDYEIEEVIQW
ncbi:MAG: type II/IV secretion system ATPase subunit [Vulcanisaeta sp.]|jgi:flagellar protein FlaI|uniref:Type II secretion system protein E n=1 Tax=Vulcanisaeta moutnovskia (strain 768-28) TaxID=985053 RepID=F0QUX6_VULM7|nr:type II/IV secretion system ATPase subunit [Vulcanisaeta moutnovskia]ADY01958.1 type II secretion system protein E [Vulcanisaeta moutnovskia 768-28]